MARDRTNNMSWTPHPWRLPPPLHADTRAQLRARVAELELANYRLERRVEELSEELAAAEARARHAARRRETTEPADVPAGAST